MPSGIASIPRYQTGGPTRRDFLKRMLGALWSSRLGLPGGAEKVLEGIASLPVEEILPNQPPLLLPSEDIGYWIRDSLQRAGINPIDVPDDIMAGFIDKSIPLPEVHFGFGDMAGNPPRSPHGKVDVVPLERIRAHNPHASTTPTPGPMHDYLLSQGHDPLLWEARISSRFREGNKHRDLYELIDRMDTDPYYFQKRPYTPTDLLDDQYKYNKHIGELLESGNARFIAGYDPTPNSYTGTHWEGQLGVQTFDPDPKDVALYQRLRGLTRTRDNRHLREAREEGEKRARGAFGRQVFGPSYDSPGILDSPSVRPSPSTAGRWGMRRGIGAFLGALGMGLGTAVDLAASPTKLGSGDLPEEDRFTDEEMEIIRAKQREEFQLLEDLGLTPRLPIGPRVSPQGASIRPRGFGRVSGGIVGLRGAA